MFEQITESQRLLAEAFSGLVQTVGNSTNTTLSSRAVIELLSLPPGLEIITTMGYATAGDGGGAVYTRVSTSAAAGGVTSGDGSFWHILPDPQGNNVRQYGAIGTSAVGAAFQDAFNDVQAGGVLIIPAGNYICDVALTRTSPIQIRGEPSQSVIFAGSVSSGTDLMTFTPSGAQGSWYLTGFTIDGQNTGVKAGVNFTGGAALDALVTDVTVQNVLGDYAIEGTIVTGEVCFCNLKGGIRMSGGGSGIAVHDNNIQQGASTTAPAISLSVGTSVHVYQNTINIGSGGGTGDGISISSAVNPDIRANDIVITNNVGTVHVRIGGGVANALIDVTNESSYTGSATNPVFANSGSNTRYLVDSASPTSGGGYSTNSGSSALPSGFNTTITTLSVPAGIWGGTGIFNLSVDAGTTVSFASATLTDGTFSYTQQATVDSTGVLGGSIGITVPESKFGLGTSPLTISGSVTIFWSGGAGVSGNAILQAWSK